MNRIFLIGIFTFLFQLARAQDCERNLAKAQQAYYNGAFSEVVDLLQCFNTLDKKEDKIIAYELQINALLLTGYKIKADSLMYGLLQLDPLYETSIVDLLPFQKLYSSYYAKPVGEIAFILGMNVPDYSIIQYRSYASISEEPEGYNATNRINLGLKGSYHLTDLLFLSSGIVYQEFGYVSSESIMGFQRVEIVEQFKAINIPLHIGVKARVANFDIALQGGLAYQLIASSKADLELFGEVPDFNTPLNGLARKEKNIDLSPIRRNHSWNYSGQITFSRRFGNYGVGASVVYEYGLTNLADRDNRYASDYLMQNFSYVSDDFKVDNLQLNVVIKRCFTKPAKR